MFFISFSNEEDIMFYGRLVIPDKLTKFTEIGFTCFESKLKLIWLFVYLEYISVKGSTRESFHSNIISTKVIHKKVEFFFGIY